MINTLLIKQQQLRQGYFAIGSGPTKMLIMGSCRVAPIVDYFNAYNEKNGNPYTIYSLDAFNFNWNVNDDRVDYAAALLEQEKNTKLLDVIGSIDIFIHEYYSHGGMFNTFKHEGKSIYDFGMKSKIDICLPNYNDIFILYGDIVTFDVEMRKKAIQDYNVTGKLSEQTQKEIFEVSQRNLQKFYDVCSKSDIPEMKRYFELRMKFMRFFHTYNHVSKHFTLAIFRYINEKYLHLEMSDDFWMEISKEDMFANSFTPITEYDVKWYGYDWRGEEIKPLRDKL